MFFTESVPVVSPVPEEFQLGQLWLRCFKRDRLCLYAVERALFGARPHHQGHQRGLIRRLLLHLFPKVHLLRGRLLLPPALGMVSFDHTNKCRLFLCMHIFCPNSKCLPFLWLSPTLWQMPQDVTNIHEDWADFCQCQEFWWHFLSFVLEGKRPFWLFSVGVSFSSFDKKWRAQQ